MKRRLFDHRLFYDRADAGQLLAEHVGIFASPDLIALGLARGGVPIAAEVAAHLRCDLDVIVARKIGAPDSPELALGAVTASGGRYVNDELIRQVDVSQGYVDRVAAEQSSEARRQEERLRGRRPLPQLEGRVVMLVDDGLATGATMRAAARSVQHQRPTMLIVATPVGSPQGCRDLRDDADEVVCLYRPDPFWAVGLYYDHFEPVEDSTVREILDRYAARHAA
jgi:putative phosphoribosyl transferase